MASGNTVHRRESRRLGLLLAAGGLACAGPAARTDPPPAADPPPAVASSDGPAAAAESPRSPLRATIALRDGQPAPGATLVLEAAVERTGRWVLPVEVRVVVPSGARLASGPEAWTVPGGETPGTDVREIVIELSSLPQQDLRLVIDSQGEAAGVHAEAAYRFGRPEPTVEPPARDGPAVRLGERDLGRSVPLR
jgi:hypothetical protein